ncbi:MAG UNVERIFIED_CONTAM: hypothetical protein LVQ98_02820 [Rickettsiaceae bacterium]|jgi:hypothetical protein
MIILQTTNYIQKDAPALYRNILSKQFKIAREIETDNSKIGINIGYFTTHSIATKKQISSGFSGGIWIEN